MYKKRMTQEFPYGFSDLLDQLVSNVKEGTQEHYYSPSVNISETKEDYTIEVLAPGLKKETFSISVENNILSITSPGRKEDERNFLKKEWLIQPFKRNFNLKDNIDYSNIVAKYEDGILTLTLAKKIEKSTRNEIIVL